MQEYSDHEVIAFIVQQLAAKYPKPPVPAEAVDERVAFWRSSGMYELPDEAWNEIAQHVKTKVVISIDDMDTIIGKGFKVWLPDRHAEINWKRWIAYKQLLAVKGFSPQIVGALDASTDEILNCMGNPADEGAWKRRGLVIGDVQSGKTATYIGAVNKAVDAGYKLIILLAGGTEALRKQTQFRVDEGLIGRDSSKTPSGTQLTNNPVFGVGNWHVGGFVSAQGLTTQATDFRKTSTDAMNIAIDPNTSTPYVFVLKKNKTALENLRDWLKGQQIGGSLIDIPMLVVDDESDYASVNTRADDSPTVINGLIRSILGTVSKSSYLAFTATPFANVFIDHETTQELLGDDLFPRDYISTLEAPSNYVGSTAYFGTEEDRDSTRLVELSDADDFFPVKHKSGHQVPGLPDSLLDAIRTFIVAVAIRESRGDSSARAMLVNVSRFKKVQAQVHELVEAEFQRIKDAIELHSVSLLQGTVHAEIAALRVAFARHFPDAGISWDELVPKLKSAVHATSVKLINSDRVKQVDDIADLESERMIAVGGDVLSRGLTLEGLTVSYFHRSVGASDTLLQMARWFGYRPGYDDLCRVWLTDDVADQFRYVASIVDDLRGQLRSMKKQGLTPQDFGLMVRMHPETLKITATSKMGGAEAKAWTVDIAARMIETTTIESNSTTIAKNVEAARQFVLSLEAAYPDRGWTVEDGPWPLMRHVDKRFIAQFLQDYIPFVTDALFADNVLSSYLEKSGNPTLQDWTVAFVKGTGSDIKVAGGLTVKAPRRAVKRGKPASRPGSTTEYTPFKVSGKSSRLGGSTDIARTFGIQDPDKRTEPDVYQAMDAGPAMMIYLIQPDTSKGSGPTDADASSLWSEARAEGAEYLVGVKIAIPGAKPGEKGAEVKYMLNSVALNSWRLTVAEPVEDDDDLADLDGVDDE